MIQNLQKPAQNADYLLEFGADYEINRLKLNLDNNVDEKILNINTNNNCTEHIPISFWEAFIQKFSDSIKTIQIECKYRETNEVKLFIKL